MSESAQRISLKRILAPTDFSDSAAASLKYASVLAERFDAELFVLHVAQDFNLALTATDLGFPPPEQLREELTEQAKSKLAELPGGSWNIKSVTREVRWGNPWQEITKFAMETQIDLIVLGTHGRSGLSHLFLGSVAERVVRAAPCPVLTVRPEGHQFVAT
ncbi:MAG: universal stress protein [Planctomycetaceae bacterium]|nr:universal stress protein [Planctomycetaceae bacterium]